jgi:ABC-type branched-subunit amino acid transport system substrate-binding protein
MKHIVSLIWLFVSTSSWCKTIVFIDNRVSNDTYIASNKERQISQAYTMGLEKLKKVCLLSSKQLIGKEPLSIFNQAEEIKSIKGSKVIFGLIHSSEALLAAEAFKTANIIGLSSGAATDQLNNNNPFFFSLANPVSDISSHVKEYILKKKLKKPIAIIPGNSSYSIELVSSLKASLLSIGLNLEIELIDTSKNNQDFIQNRIDSKNYDFIYVPGFLQQTLPIFESVTRTDFKGTVYGSANLARSKTDLKLFSDSLKLKNLTLRFPATWLSGETRKSSVLENEFRKRFGEEIMGTAIYTYDAVLIAGSFLCKSTKEPTPNSFSEFLKNEVIKGKLPSVRKYYGLKNGHLISSIRTVRYNSTSQRLEAE